MKINKETRDTIKMYQANDWEFDSEEETHVLLKKNTGSFGKHFVVFLLTAWFTFGIGNVVYHFVSKKTKKIMK